MASDAWLITVADQAAIEQVKVLAADLTVEKAQVFRTAFLLPV